MYKTRNKKTKKFKSGHKLSRLPRLESLLYKTSAAFCASSDGILRSLNKGKNWQMIVDLPGNFYHFFHWSQDIIDRAVETAMPPKVNLYASNITHSDSSSGDIFYYFAPCKSLKSSKTVSLGREYTAFKSPVRTYPNRDKLTNKWWRRSNLKIDARLDFALVI